MSFKPGDWKCHRCDEHNFRRNKRCFGCNAYKPMERKPGDWNCRSCQAVNFKNREECFKCKEPKIAPETVKEETKIVEEEIKDVKADDADENEACKICFEFKKIISFQPCGHVLCCNKCSKSVSECPLCKTKIANRVRVFV